LRWRTEVEQLLALFKRHRRTLVLIEASSLTGPDAAAQHAAIRQRLQMPGLQLPLECPTADQPQEKPEGPEADDTQACLAHLSQVLLHHDPALPGLLAELDAASISPLAGHGPGAAPAADTMMVLARWQAGTGRAQELEAQAERQKSRLDAFEQALEVQQQELSALKAERDLLRRQVELQLEEITAQASDRDSLSPETHPEFRLMARRLQEQERKLAAAEEERAFLRQQMGADGGSDTAPAGAVAGAQALLWTSADLIERVLLGPGATRSDGVIRLSADSVRAHALYGPYLRLPPGTYEANIVLRMKPRGIERPVAVLELAWNVDDVLGSCRVEGARFREKSFVLRQMFTVTPEQGAEQGQGLEIRLWTDLISAGEVSLVCLTKM